MGTTAGQRREQPRECGEELRVLRFGARVRRGEARLDARVRRGEARLDALDRLLDLRRESRPRGIAVARDRGRAGE